ncbi:cadherin-87A isoform X2 [Cylas formicarius]|nr:cadherin-87A isoform X2 [Cylas formicarius]XP_060523659.1 cadherin-87A isoform X2 [Cylas formicarius]XP_060523660.1 cadherin-87A isoform X2 [Cylas formicarius]XP_060523661.1 cadherin-87A isoform X2 [Cylas formicarius]
MKHFWNAILWLLMLLTKCRANLPPVFTMDMNNIVISENIPVGTTIYKLEGTDPEDGPVYYDIQGTDVLSVNHTTGVVTVLKPLDYEANSTLNVIVSIEDEVPGGVKNNVVEEQVAVIILDENDNTPEFQNAPYEIQVDEDTEPGTTIFEGIVVKDKDTAGQNIEVTCINIPSYDDACDTFRIQDMFSKQNSYQGSIILNKKLSYNENKAYAFTLKATDGTLTSTTNVSVLVGDVQDTPPMFLSNLTADLYENSTINTLVMTVKAQDGDRGIPRGIVYELISNPMDYFILDPMSGELRTARPLDKEAINNPEGIIKFEIKAHELVDGVRGNDPLTVTTAEAMVKILDINDEPPIFNKREYYVEIPENIPEGSGLPGLNMVVTDPDEGNNSVFSLELNDISGAFSIEPKIANGSTPATVRVINSLLDYEDPNQRKFIILAVAKEIYTEEKLSSTATITVSVMDVNDNVPTFDQQSYSATVSEMYSPGSLVVTIVAKDRDSGKFGESGLVYSLTGDGSDKFSVNNRTGTVTVDVCTNLGKPECLDYESKSEYHLQFVATDDDGKGQATSVPLKISLTDYNDNPPIFNKSIYRVFVNEGATRFEPDLVIEARDADKTSHVTYSIVSGNDEELFKIDSETGKLRITNNRGLDVSNDTDNVISLTILATDGEYTTTTLVNITVLDINNNAPIFSKESYVEAVPEDVPIGISILEVQAADADTGVNAEIEYFFQKGAYDDFTIDSTSGVVTVASKLDFDRRNTYNIEVCAVDHGEPSLTGTASITITIINTNDKLPYFVPTTQKAEVMEDVPVGAIVHTLIALDPDVNASEALNFEASQPITALDKHGNAVFFSNAYEQFFSIDKISGQVTVANPLQRDIAAIVRIPILVTDITASTMQQGQGLLEITILDINDSPPSFLPPWTVENPVYYLELKEELPVGTIVATYKAIDEDSDIAGYTIQPNSEYFQINNGTGIVQIKKVIDYEKIKKLNFTVVAFDSGIPQLNTTATVMVNVVNLNDNDPIFAQNSYNVSIDENSPNGTFVLQVKALDNDSEEYGEVIYSLTGEHSNDFNIDAKTGIITVANSNLLDHELIKQCVVQVVARDNSPVNVRRSMTVPVYIKINDVNDNVPKFTSQEYEVDVMEDVRLNPPVPLIHLNATDLDSGLNGNIHYSIIGGNENDLFLLGVDTGILYPHKSLIGRTGKFHLVVEARDGAGNGELFDRATLKVNVLNVNDHRPVFIIPYNPNSTVDVLENAAQTGFLVLTVKAKDKDQGENGRVTYHFKSGEQNVQETDEFSINEKTGELKVKRNLDREEHPKYELVLVARDHGSPKWFETTRHLTVLLVDENDNRPEFPGSTSTNPYHFFVTENNSADVLIGQVRALDRDEGNHAKVYYYILKGNEDGSFNLNKATGNLYAAKSFDRELQNEYSLVIVANNDPDYYVTAEEISEMEEKGMLNDKSIAHAIVTINDVNDNEPYFQHQVYYTAVNAMANVNDFVTNVTAYDPDLGVNGSLTYYIKTSNLFKYHSNKSSGSIIPSPFNISQRGEIYTATYLAENNQHRFVLNIIAREDGFPEREANAQVYVWIFEPEQLIRVILSRPREEVRKEKDGIVSELSNATQSLIIIDEIRFHIGDGGRKNEEWTDMYILAVNPKTNTILAVPDVLKVIDSKYDFLKDYYAGFAIENVVPAFVQEREESFDPALAALIALLIVLFVGVLSFIIVCCCLRHWVISPHDDLKKKDALIKKAIIDDLTTTENPLWIEQKLKIYEEQELTMQVFNEPEQNMMNRRDSEDYVPEDNTYATIQHPHKRTASSHLASTMGLADDLGDYATLKGVVHQSGSNNSSLRGAPNYYEAATMGFQGSTFQVPDRLSDSGGGGSEYGSYRARPKSTTGLTIGYDGQPEYVAELI